MLTKSNVLFLIIFLFFAGCMERLPEEKFDILPSSGFPRLGDVPDRPRLPDPVERKKIENHLLQDRTEAEREREEVRAHLE